LVCWWGVWIGVALGADSPIKVLTPTPQTHRAMAEEGVFLTSKPSILIKGNVQPVTRLLLNGVPVSVDMSGRFYEVVSLQPNLKTNLQLITPDIPSAQPYVLQVMYVPVGSQRVETPDSVIGPPAPPPKESVTYTPEPVNEGEAEDEGVERSLDPVMLFLPRGATVEGEKVVVTTSNIILHGLSHDVTAIHVNGEPVAMKPNGRFSFPLNGIPRTGITLKVVATLLSSHRYTKKIVVVNRFPQAAVVPVDPTPTLYIDGVAATHNVIDIKGDRWVLKGRTHRAGSLTVNDVDVTVQPDGTFSIPIRLMQADARIRLVAQGQGTVERRLLIQKTAQVVTPAVLATQPVNQPVSPLVAWEWASPVLGAWPKGVVIVNKPAVFLKARTAWSGVKINHVTVPVGAMQWVHHRLPLQANVVTPIVIEGMGPSGKEKMVVTVCYQPSESEKRGVVKQGLVKGGGTPTPALPKPERPSGGWTPSGGTSKPLPIPTGEQKRPTDGVTSSKLPPVSGFSDPFKRMKPTPTGLSEGERSKMMAQMMKTYQLMEKGNERFYKKEYTKAVAAYEEARTLMPRYPDIYVRMGSIYFRMREWEKAEKMWHTALTLDPQYPDLKTFIAKARQSRLQTQQVASGGNKKTG